LKLKYFIHMLIMYLVNLRKATLLSLLIFLHEISKWRRFYGDKNCLATQQQKDQTFNYEPSCFKQSWIRCFLFSRFLKNLSTDDSVSSDLKIPKLNINQTLM
jgi:hypothetical protein